MFMLAVVSCSHDTYRVVKYSDSSVLKDDYYDFYSPINDQFVIKNKDYYYVTADTILHYKKISSSGRKLGYEKIIVEDDNGKKYIVDAYYDESGPIDKFVFLNLIDNETNENVYSFVIDWQSKSKNIKTRERIASLH